MNRNMLSAHPQRSQSAACLTRRNLLKGALSSIPLLLLDAQAQAQTPGGYPTALPQKALWESNAREWAGYLQTYLTQNPANDAGQLATYYDFMRVGYQMSD